MQAKIQQLRTVFFNARNFKPLTHGDASRFSMAAPSPRRPPLGLPRLHQCSQIGGIRGGVILLAFLIISFAHGNSAPLSDTEEGVVWVSLNSSSQSASNKEAGSQTNDAPWASAQPRKGSASLSKSGAKVSRGAGFAPHVVVLGICGAALAFMVRLLLYSFESQWKAGADPCRENKEVTHNLPIKASQAVPNLPAEANVQTAGFTHSRAIPTGSLSSNEKNLSRGENPL